MREAIHLLDKKQGAQAAASGERKLQWGLTALVCISEVSSHVRVWAIHIWIHACSFPRSSLGLV